MSSTASEYVFLSKPAASVPALTKSSAPSNDCGPPFPSIFANVYGWYKILHKTPYPGTRNSDGIEQWVVRPGQSILDFTEVERQVGEKKGQGKGEGKEGEWVHYLKG